MTPMTLRGRGLALQILLMGFAWGAFAGPVEITLKPKGLVHTKLSIPVTTSVPLERLELFVNGVKHSEARGRSVVFTLDIGKYVRRLRIRVVGFDAAGQVAGEDEMVVNDPRPPFRVRLGSPQNLPQSGSAELTANVIAPESLSIAGVDFYVGEQKLGSDDAAPFSITFDPTSFKEALYARVAARAADGSEANDVRFFGTAPSDQIDVSLQQLPISATGNGPLDPRDVSLIDSGEQVKIEGIVPAADQPLYVVLLIDTSESMLKELPVVRAAARGFIEALLRPSDRLAVVEVNDRTFWLTDFTADRSLMASALEKIYSRGETHLYDALIETLYELQKRPGRHALVVLTDGVNQGGSFALDHVVHYARYAGVPIYPIIKNAMLSRLMRFGVGRLEAQRLTGIARDTGATYFIIQGERELPNVYARIATELRQQSLLMFYSQTGPQDRWHPVAVRSKSNRSIRAPKGYFP